MVTHCQQMDKSMLQKILICSIGHDFFNIFLHEKCLDPALCYLVASMAVWCSIWCPIAGCFHLQLSDLGIGHDLGIGVAHSR